MADHPLFGAIDPAVKAQFAISAYRYNGGKRELRIAWLRCMEAGVAVPDGILEAFMDDVCTLTRNTARTPESLQTERHEKNVLKMLYHVKTKPSLVRKFIDPSSSSKDILNVAYPVHVLEKISHRLLTVEYTSPGLYKLFGELLEVNGEQMERKFKHFKKKLADGKIIL